MALKIVVLAKQVPDTRNVGKDAMTAEGTVNRAALPAIFNPEDLNALEQALRLKEQNPGSTVGILTMGPPRAGEIIRQGLYRGADTGWLLTDRLFAGADTLATSYALATAIKKIGDVDIVIGGRQAIDGDTAQVGPQVAQKLGLNQVTYAEDVLSVKDGKATIGEMRALAPDWWDHTEKDILSGRYDDRLRSVRRVLGILTSVDRSMMTPDELKVHDAFVEKLSAAQEADVVLLDGMSDETTIAEMYKAFGGTFAQYRDVDFKAERSALIDMISRAYGLADGDAARFSSVFKDVDGALQDVPAGSFEDFRKSFKDGKTAGSQAHGETEVSK